MNILCILWSNCLWSGACLWSDHLGYFKSSHFGWLIERQKQQWRWEPLLALNACTRRNHFLFLFHFWCKKYAQGSYSSPQDSCPEGQTSISVNPLPLISLSFTGWPKVQIQVFNRICQYNMWLFKFHLHLCGSESLYWIKQWASNQSSSRVNASHLGI